MLVSEQETLKQKLDDYENLDYSSRSNYSKTCQTLAAKISKIHDTFMHDPQFNLYDLEILNLIKELIDREVQTVSKKL